MTQQVAQHAAMTLPVCLILGAEVRGLDVADAKSIATDLIGVGWSDALSGGADLGTPLGLLIGGIEETMGRQYEVGLAGDT